MFLRVIPDFTPFLAALCYCVLCILYEFINEGQASSIIYTACHKFSLTSSQKRNVRWAFPLFLKYINMCYTYVE